MSRRRSHRAEISVSLFPFLAVLICTMGSLIVLLVVVVQQAKGQAQREVTHVSKVTPPPRRVHAPIAPATEPVPSGPTQAELDETNRRREQLLWEIEQMQLAREQTLQSVREQRDELSHLEDHIRRLQSQLEQLQNDAQRIAAARSDETTSTLEQDQQLEALRNELAAARGELDQRQQQLAQAPSSHIIMPYNGQGGTARRPVFIECVGDRVILQPEGIVLTEEDFADTGDANNPLAVALRAVREYSSRVNPNSNENPYPLLVVRPSGAFAFASCRQALNGWDDEFGYELVDDSIELSYPSPNPELQETLKVAVDAARRQQEIRRSLIAARRDGPSSGGFRASRTGGFVASKAAANTATGKPSGTSPGKNSSAGGVGEGSSSDDPQQLPNDTDPVARFGSAPLGQRQPQDHSSTATSSQRTDTWEPSDAPSAASGDLSDSTATGDSNGLGTAHLDQTAESQASANGHASNANSPNASAPTSPASRTAPSTSTADSPSRPNGAPGNPSTEDGPGGISITPNATPLSRELGQQWAVRDRGESGIPITRPIRLQVSQSKIVLAGEIRGQKATDLPMTSATRDVVDPLVHKIWQRIDGWGTAGSTMYWQPTIEVSVAPGGEKRYAELEALLQGSGLEMTRIR